MLRPTFYIIGFPKCGTTAIASYLADNPNILFAKHKEPHYHASDFTDPITRRVTTEAEYLAQFASNRTDYCAVGEASTGYIFSANAIDNCLDYSSDPKFVVIVRNPVDMIASIHAQMLQSGHEDIEDLAHAWSLSPSRSEGKNLPQRKTESIFIRYQDFARMATYIGRVQEKVGADRLKVIVYDDLVVDPRGVYTNLIQWLGVSDDQRTHFNVLNPRGYHRYRTVANFINEPPRSLLRLSEWIKKVAGLKRLSIIDFLRRCNFQHKVRDVDERLAKEIANHYAEEVQQLETLINRSLNWSNGISKRN